MSGINLITMICQLLTEFTKKSVDGLTKNDHFQSMLQIVAEHGFMPEFMLLDTWPASLDNLKFIRSFGQHWLTRLECSRHISPDKMGNRSVKKFFLSEQSDTVYHKGYDMIKAFKKVRRDDDIECWAANDLEMTDLLRLKYAEISLIIETYHRGIKQLCGIERCQEHSEKAQQTISRWL